jgi:hypothetical protein
MSQLALGLPNARVSEHQLDDADVDAVREQAARALVAQVVPTASRCGAGRVFFRTAIPSATCFDHPPATADDVGAIPEPAREAGKANAPTASLTGRRAALSSLNRLWEHRKPAS